MLYNRSAPWRARIRAKVRRPRARVKPKQGTNAPEPVKVLAS
ncbi:hypothetical protein C882_4560 [Caenispirillum salinarum AK4]|uniref:Uncharacterized protein n=1 Tax=Caenispirillum salinarum AK4 TaxID=1238182 RepID=K9GW46_9PROT|nr:hypothetical protein C882_4560 [Caenispirillum salinarum AK4]